MSDKVFRRMAVEYVEQSGVELKAELDKLLLEGTPQITPSLDRRVRGRVGALKRMRYLRNLGLVAACLTLVLLLPSVLRQQQSSPPAEMSAPVAAPVAAPATYEMIPLSFAMPASFSVASVEQDIEKTVYYIANSGLDDIVMTLEHADSLAPYSGLTPVDIGGYTAYGCAEQGYRLLALEKQGVLYVLTCEHDINTLVELGACILENV